MNWSWLWDDAPKERDLSLSSVPVKDLPLLGQGLAEKLLPYQVDPVRNHVRCLKKYNVAIDGSFCGIGKTYIYLATCKALNLRPLILSPKSVIEQTRRVAANHFGMDVVDVVSWEGIKTGRGQYLSKSEDKRIAGGYRFEWKLPPDCVIIADEAQKMKSQTSQASQMIIDAYKQRIPIMAVSATLATSPVEMKALGLLTGLHQGHDFEQFMFDHGVKLTKYGYFFPPNGKIIHDIGRKIFPERGVRIKPSDVKGLFPETQILPLVFDPLKKKDAEEINSLYSELQKELNSTIGKYHHRSQENLAVLMKYHRKIEMIKSDLLVDIAKDHIAEGCNVAIFCNFRDTVLKIANELGCPYVMGEQKPQDRQRAIDMFQEDKARSIVCTIAAGGAGLSLHSVGDKRMRVALICPTFNAVDFKQALGRVHRANGNPSIQKIVYVAGTPESRASQKVKTKLDNLGLLTDGVTDEDLNNF